MDAPYTPVGTRFRARTAKEGVHGGTMGSPVPNRLLRIEEELGGRAQYPGWSAFPRAVR